MEEAGAKGQRVAGGWRDLRIWIILTRVRIIPTGENQRTSLKGLSQSERIPGRKKMGKEKSKGAKQEVKNQIGLHSITAGPSRKEGGWSKGRQPIRSVRGRATGGE